MQKRSVALVGVLILVIAGVVWLYGIVQSQQRMAARAGAETQYMLTCRQMFDDREAACRALAAYMVEANYDRLQHCDGLTGAGYVMCLRDRDIAPTGERLREFE